MGSVCVRGAQKRGSGTKEKKEGVSRPRTKSFNAQQKQAGSEKRTEARSAFRGRRPRRKDPRLGEEMTKEKGIKDRVQKAQRSRSNKAKQGKERKGK